MELPTMDLERSLRLLMSSRELLRVARWERGFDHELIEHTWKKIAATRELIHRSDAFLDREINDPTSRGLLFPYSAAALCGTAPVRGCSARALGETPRADVLNPPEALGSV